MSLAPIDSSTRSSLRSGWRRFAAVTASRSSASCAFEVMPHGGISDREPAVRIHLTRGDAVAKTGHEDIAHRDLGGNALAAVRAGGDVDGRHRGAAIADPGIDRLGAVEGGSLRAVAIVERPGAGGAD